MSLTETEKEITLNQEGRERIILIHARRRESESNYPRIEGEGERERVCTLDHFKRSPHLSQY